MEGGFAVFWEYVWDNVELGFFGIVFLRVFVRVEVFVSGFY